jgi:hypothetical protein
MRTRTVAAHLLGAAIFACVITVAPTANALVSGIQGTPADPVQRLGACLSAGGQGDFLLVLDESASLTTTDPDDQRVDAAQYLVRQLGAFVDESDVKIDVSVAGFADRFTTPSKWTSLTGASAEGLADELDAYRERDHGFETDYWQAVTGARKTLAARQPADEQHCQAFVWFSDGQFDLDYRDTDQEKKDYGETKPYANAPLTSASAADAAEADGLKDLCRSGGVADQLRVLGITTLAVGLKPADSTADFDLMDSIATGSGTCGDLTEPVPGEFLTAADVDDLLFEFDQFATPDQDPLTQNAGICPQSPCQEGTHEFVLDPSISKVHILGDSSVPGEVLLRGPKGTAVSIAAGKDSKTPIPLPGATLTYAWLSDTALQLDLARTRDQGWDGTWQLVFVDPSATDVAGRSRSSIHLYGDLAPAWLGADTTDLLARETVPLQLGLTHQGTGDVVDPSAISSILSLGVTLEYADGTTQELATGLDNDAISEPVDLDLTDATPGAAILQLSLQVTTVRDVGGRTVPGTQLEPMVVGVPVTILPPPDFPTVASTVDFGSMEEPETVTADLRVEGSGCVWLGDDQTSLTLPDGLDELSVSSPADSAESCVTITDGGVLPLEVTPETAANGLASGRLNVMSVPDQGSEEPVATQVQYQLEMQVPRDTSTLIWVLAVVMLVGLGLPLILIYLAKWWSARIPADSLLVGALDGPVDEQRFAPSASLAVTAMQSVVLAGTSRRRVTLPTGPQLRTSAGLGLTEPGYALVDSSGYSASSGHPPTTRKGVRGRLPLAVQKTWVVTLDTSDPMSGPVHVHVILASSGDGLDDVVADAHRRVPEVVARLRSRVRHGDGTPPPPATSGASDDWADTSGIPGTTPSSGRGTPPPSTTGTTSWDDQW